MLTNYPTEYQAELSPLIVMRSLTLADTDTFDKMRTAALREGTAAMRTAREVLGGPIVLASQRMDGTKLVLVWRRR